MIDLAELKRKDPNIGQWPKSAVDAGPCGAIITYLCSGCGNELGQGEKCPECGKRAKGYDLLAEEIARQRKRAESREKYGDRAGLFKG